MPEQPSAIEFLSGVTTPTTTPLTDSAVQNAPRIVQPPVGRVATPAETQEGQYMQANTIQGVPFDPASGLDTMTLLRLSFIRDMDDQIKMLQRKYPGDTIRMSTDGVPIVRVMDKDTGKPKDVLINERGMGLDDFISIVGAVPEIAGSILAMRKANAAPALKALTGFKGAVRDIASMTAGSAAGGAAKDVVSAALEPAIDIEPGKIAKRTAQGAALDAALGAILGGASKIAKFITNPLAGGRGKLQFDALEAQKYFKDTYGIDIPLSVGESTGSSLFQRMESFVEKMPGGKGPLAATRAEQENLLRDLQDIIVGPKGAMTSEEVGQRVIGDLRGKTQGVKDTAEESRLAIAKEAQQKIESGIGAVTTPEKQLYKTEVGEQIRGKITELRDAAKAEDARLFGIAKELEGGSGKAFPAKTLSEDAKKALEKLPSKTTITEEASPIIGVSGQPISIKTVEGKEVLREFVPPNILSRLNQLAGMGGEKLSLSELQQMRREVYDDIEKGSAVPGIGTHYLSDIGKMLTKAIDEGVSSLPNGELKTALQAANQHHRTRVIPFSDNPINALFARSNEPGFQGNFAVAQKFMKDPDAFLRLRDTLGSNSPEFRNLKRAIADDIIENAKIPGTDTLDGKAFLKGLESFRRGNREVAEEVLGKDVSNLVTLGHAMELSQGAKIDEKLAQEIIRSGRIDPTKIRTAVAAQREADVFFRNNIFEAIGKGESPKITADEFVNKLLEGTNSKGIREVLGALSDRPELLEEIRAKTMQKVFRDNARASTLEQVDRALAGENTRLVSAGKIGNYLDQSGGTMRDKIKTILGDEAYSEFDKYVKLQLVPEAKDATFKGAGGLGAAQVVSSLLRLGPLKYVTDATKFFVESMFLSNPLLRKWASHVPPAEWDTFSQALITSTPFLEAVTKEFGADGAKAFMHDMKSSIDHWATDESKKPSKPQGISAEEYLTQGIPEPTVKRE